MIGPSEFDPGGDDRTPLQKDYGALTGRYGDPEGDIFAGLDPEEEAQHRAAQAEEKERKLRKERWYR